MRALRFRCCSGGQPWINPQEAGWRHNYALYAYKAEQWQVLNPQIPLLGQVNYEYFGGKDEYEKMIRLAKEHEKSKQALHL